MILFQKGLGMKKQKNLQNSLIIASSERHPDLYYATKFLAPDPFVFMEIRNKKYMIVSDLEIDRARKQAKVHHIVSATALSREYRQKYNRPPRPIELVCYFLKKQKVKSILIPGDFPVEHFDILKRAGFRISYKKGMFYDQRAIKRPEEIRAIQQALRITEQAVQKAVSLLKKSKIKKGKLYFQGKFLTSEGLRQIIHQALLEKGCIPEHSIISCGKQTADPHHRGSGPLYAHQPIVMDIFPKNERTGYFADFTRTVIRGKASLRFKKMYTAVQEAQKIAFKMIRSGVIGSKIHQAICKRFSELGFETGEKNGRMQGFFHSTGHGLGLEIHEAPRIGPGNDILKTGQVVTVEPGLYYPDIGGIRLEDVVVVTRKGCKNLTRFPRQLEI